MCDTYGRGKVPKWKWVDGRQGSGYKIFYLWEKIFDLVIIRYPDGSHIDPHCDPVPAHLNHHRINITLRRPRSGGVFHCDAEHIIVKCPRFTWFRPDLGMHSVSKVEGERWLLSIGWVRRK